jgi:murein tripeptide amidase MpaA
MEDLLVDFPTLFSSELAGTSAEGRPINAYRVSKQNGRAKPVIVVESGLRPREWLSNMAVLYFIHELVEHDYEFPDLLENVDLVFIPVSNPDGYAFSFTSGGRNWNKNRRTNAGSSCLGVDINRNFEYQFLASSNVSEKLRRSQFPI